MSLNILIDMNMSIEWVDVFHEAGHSAIHWSSIGDFRADDTVIMDWALKHGYIVFTHDLDFGSLLALTDATGPSVLQVRSMQLLPEQLKGLVLSTLLTNEADLLEGALVTVDPKKSRVRVLPISQMG